MNRSRHFRFSPWPVALPICAIAMAVAVFAVTQSVQHREAHVNELNRQLLSEQQTLRVLDAEWAYLTRPQRLEELIAMREDHGVMPPAPIPVANVIPDEQPQVAAVEPASGQIAQSEETKVEAPVKKAEAVQAAQKKTAKTEIKKAPVKTAAATPKKTNTASMDGAWKITPKKAAYVAQPRAQSRTVASIAPRAGVARPIVE